MTTHELFSILGEIKDGRAQDLLKELQMHQLELEIQNRELREVQQQLAHSRIRYADLFDFSPIGYAGLDENGVIEEINITGGKLLGENPHKLVGRALSDFVAADDHGAFLDHLRRCQYSRNKHSIDIQLFPAGGSPIDIQLFTMATRDADRRTLQFRTAMIDITMRKRAEGAVRETQRHLEDLIAQRTAALTSERRQREDAKRFLYDASSILAMSLDYDVTLWNIAHAGVPHLADACVVDMVRDDGTVVRAAVANAEADREDELRDIKRFPLAGDVIRTGEGSLEENSITVPLLVRGKTVGAIRLMLGREARKYNAFDWALAEDLADRAAIALDNATLYTRELDANRLKDEFLSIVSHELRTPLTPILGAIYKLRSSRSSDPELQSSLDIIERNAKAQARIVEELLDLSRITAGRLDFKREPTDITLIVQGAVDAMQPSIDALHIRLRTRFEPLTQLIWCDRDRIQQVVWHLLSNAIKFTGPGGEIDVVLESLPGRARLRITDTGAGIHADFLPHIFDNFRQGSAFLTRLHGGLGAGLSIVRHIVERHGGVVRAESPGEGQGSTFTVDLPFPNR